MNPVVATRMTTILLKKSVDFMFDLRLDDSPVIRFTKIDNVLQTCDLKTGEAHWFQTMKVRRGFNQEVNESREVKAKGATEGLDQGLSAVRIQCKRVWLRLPDVVVIDRVWKSTREVVVIKSSPGGDGGYQAMVVKFQVRA